MRRREGSCGVLPSVSGSQTRCLKKGCLHPGTFAWWCWLWHLDYFCCHGFCKMNLLTQCTLMIMLLTLGQSITRNRDSQ
jgi:hypothetical protein